MLDEDRSGKVTRFEAMRLLKTFNLSGVRQKVIHQICAIVSAYFFLSACFSEAVRERQCSHPYSVNSKQ